MLQYSQRGRRGEQADCSYFRTYVERITAHCNYRTDPSQMLRHHHSDFTVITYFSCGCVCVLGVFWPVGSFSLLFRICFSWKQLPNSCRLPLSKDEPSVVHVCVIQYVVPDSVQRGCGLIISISCNRKWSQLVNSARLA